MRYGNCSLIWYDGGSGGGGGGVTGCSFHSSVAVEQAEAIIVKQQFWKKIKKLERTQKAVLIYWL